MKIKTVINRIICSIVGHDYQTLVCTDRKYKITVCKRCGKRWARITTRPPFVW